MTTRIRLLCCICVALTEMACGDASSPAGGGSGKSEGSAAAPVQLALDQTHAGSVASGEASYYRFIPAHTHSLTIQLGDVAGGDLFLTIEPDTLSLTGPATEMGALAPTGRFLHDYCDNVTNYGQSRNFDSGFECLLSVAAGHPYVLKVSNEIVSFLGGGVSETAPTTYQLRLFVDPASPGQGSLESPVLITPDVPYQGSIGLYDLSFYTFVAQKDHYDISATTDSTWPELSTAMLGPDGKAMACPNGSMGNCLSMPTVPGQRYIVIVGFNGSSTSTAFTLTILGSPLQ